MSCNLYNLPIDLVKLIFENVEVRSRLMLAHSFRSPTLIRQARIEAFRAKYGELTETEKGLPIEEVIRKVRYSTQYVPSAISLRMEDGLLILKYRGEPIPLEISLEETDGIFKKVNSILEGLNRYADDFLPPTTLEEQKNIKRRRYRILTLFNHYYRLYQETAAFYRFPVRIAALHRGADTPAVCVGVCGEFVIKGSFMWGNRYEFKILEKTLVKCAFTLNFNRGQELCCFLPEISQIRACHLIMLKTIVAIFFRQNQMVLSLYHPIHFIFLLYEVGIGEFCLKKESALKLARKQGKHLYETTQLAPLPQEKLRLTSLYKAKMDSYQREKTERSISEVKFNWDGPILG